MANKNNFLPLIGLIFLGAVNFFLANQSVIQRSPTFDEPVHLTAGYVYLTEGNYKQQYRFNGFDHPPFAEMWAALPLLFQPVSLPKGHPAWQTQKWRHFEQYPFANAFVFANEKVSSEVILNSGRRMIWFFSLFLGVALFFAARKAGGLFAGLLAATWWAFSPTLLAHGTVVSTDMAFALFYFLFFWRASQTERKRDWILLGAALAGCLTSKFFGVLVFPAWAAILLWKRFQSKEGLFHRVEKKSLQQVGIVLGVAVLLIAVLYRFDGLDIFYKGARNMFLRANTADHPSFFLGEYGPGRKLLYFPFAFLVKTPLPLLLGFVIALGLALMKKARLKPEFVIPPLVIFGAACMAQKQIGHRYILSVYPFLIYGVSVLLMSAPVSNKLLQRILGGGLAIWMAVGTLSARPRFLEYFNPLMGGPEKAYLYLTDSNVDWGQGLKSLGDALPPAIKEEGIYLDYFGVTPPGEYKIRFIPIGRGGLLGLGGGETPETLQPTTLVVSVTNYQADLAEGGKLYDFLRERPPDQLIDYSLMVFNLTKQERARFERALRHQGDL